MNATSVLTHLYLTQGNSIYFLKLISSVIIRTGDENGDEQAGGKHWKYKRPKAAVGKPEAQTGRHIDHRAVLSHMPRRRFRRHGSLWG